MCSFVDNDKLKYNELLEAQKLSARCGLRMTLVDFELPEWDIIQKRDRLEGTSLTGIRDCFESVKYTVEQEVQLIQELKRISNEAANNYAKELRICSPLLVTTLKPEGCSRRDMLVSTSKGLLRLDEIGRINGNKWQNISNLQAFVETGFKQNITKFYVNGNTKTRLFVTKNGLEIESTLQHKYKILENNISTWKEVKDLNVGDKLIVKLGCSDNIRLSTPRQVKLLESEYFKQPKYLTENISHLIGLFYSCGILTDELIQFKFQNNFNKFAPGLCKILQTTFGVNVIIQNNIIICDNIDLINWFKINNCCDDMIPILIRCASKNCILSFIYAYLKDNNKLNNKIFAQQMLILCRSVGMNVQIKCIDNMWYINENDCISDEIVSICDSQCDTYDIEVENDHNYILGGCVSHNTLSQVCGGVSPGLHYSHAAQYIRRIRINARDPLAQAIKELHWNLVPEIGTPGNTFEEQMNNARVYVVDFPVQSGSITTKNQVSAKEQLDVYFRYQKYYTDHNSSNTITVKPNEWDEVEQIIYDNWDDFVGVSFLALDGGTYKLAPYEECSREHYEILKNQMKPLTMELLSKYEHLHDDIEFDMKNDDCSGGVCPLR